MPLAIKSELALEGETEKEQKGSYPFLHYSLPAERIAQRPKDHRESSRLLVAARSGAELELRDATFAELPDLLNPGDLLVLNNTKVLPWRFFALQEGSEREIELLILRRENTGGRSERWSALARPMRKLKAGDTLKLGSEASVTVVGRNAEGNEIIIERLAGDPFPEGLMPIPPYIRGGRGDALDRDSYQTVYATVEGSIAAPTAGLHFTPELFSHLTGRGISHSFITLHLGPASFLPVREDALESHQMTEEYFTIPEETCAAIDRARSQGGRVVAVGTSTVRALESAAIAERVAGAACLPGSRQMDFSSTRLFITPGFQFQVVDALITNFHQPLSTHLLLVAALLGERQTELCYQHALSESYRFLSYGDAMLIL